jgi:endonuclease-3
MLRASLPPLTRRLSNVADRLAGVYGRPRRRLTDPLSDLIGTVLSQNTSDLNSGRAYRSLRAAFPTWAAVARARPRDVERAIRVGGLARTKSRRIVSILRDVRAREGRYDLGSLRRLDHAAADGRLRGLRGVGPKTRACVLLFAAGHPAFPVDTHVHRIARRVGLVPETANAERTHAILEPVVPEGRALDLHLNLIRLGREICRPSSPRCPRCPLRAVCRHARRSL